MIHSIIPPTYPLSALEPHFDAATMALHVNKHHQTYADKLNAALIDQPQVSSLSLADLLKYPFTTTPADTKIKNMAGGVANHNLFWTLLSPDGDQPVPEPLAAALTKQFGSLDDFKTKFTDSATNLFGSGWTWLVKQNQTLSIINLPNQDSPLSQGLTPLLALDLWEHAYYLKYQNRRPEFIAAFWHLVNWTEVNRLYQAPSFVSTDSQPIRLQ
jgi:Fe-Mn family superoxide dismutase